MCISSTRPAGVRESHRTFDSILLLKDSLQKEAIVAQQPYYVAVCFSVMH
jgi:hypothetical protein